LILPSRFLGRTQLLPFIVMVHLLRGDFR
jgi:hypothetical protein